MDHVAGPLHILLAGKEGRVWFHIICLKLYQFKRITWWRLSVVDNALQSLMLKKILKKVMVSRNLRQAHLLEVSLTKISGDHETLFIVHHVGLFIHIVFFEPSGLHHCVWSELGRSLPFWPMRALKLQWSQGPLVLCAKWPLDCNRISLSLHLEKK